MGEKREQDIFSLEDMNSLMGEMNEPKYRTREKARRKSNLLENKLRSPTPVTVRIWHWETNRGHCRLRRRNGRRLTRRSSRWDRCWSFDLLTPTTVTSSAWRLRSFVPSLEMAGKSGVSGATYRPLPARSQFGDESGDAWRLSESEKLVGNG